jgi:diguanylate cyclase (GGDEF)-like protein
MRDEFSTGSIQKFIEEYECTKRNGGGPCRLNGASLLKVIKENEFENLLGKMKLYEEYWQGVTCIQERISSIFTINEFFDLLLPEARKAFKLPYLWLTVIEGGPVDSLVKQVMPMESLEKNIGFMKPAKFNDFFKNGFDPIIACKYTAPYTLFLPEKNNFTVKSMAIMPFHIAGALAGSLNLGHFVTNRFVPEMDTNLIRQFVLTLSLCLSRIVAQEKVKYLEYHDPLTLLPNRTSLMTDLDREFRRASRYKKDLSVIFFDIDGFKELNEHYGHDYGEMAIKYVAETLKSHCRIVDTVARFSGDEFALILPESNFDVSKILAKRIQDHLDGNPFDYKEIKFQLSLNHGAASVVRNKAETPEQLLKAAYRKLNNTKPRKLKVLEDVNNPVIYNIRAM